MTEREKQMKAIEIINPGRKGYLQIGERPMPEPKAGEALIKVHAAGVNRPDVLQRIGRYPVPEGASDILGLEIAGEIVGGDLSGTHLKVGDMVCALVQGGGYAEYCTAHAALCMPIPKGLTPVEAASLPETYFTVWTNVFDIGQLKGDDTFLLQAGASGIGVAAIQMVKAMGHKVFATALTDEECEKCEVLGADHCINSTTENFAEFIMEVTEGKGVDVILDMLGGSVFDKEIDCLAQYGRLVLIAYIVGRSGTADLSQILHRQLTVTGSTLRPKSNAFKADIARNLEKHIWPLLEVGKIKPVIYRVYPLEEAMDAHLLMQSNTHFGKIVLQVA